MSEQAWTVTFVRAVAARLTSSCRAHRNMPERAGAPRDTTWITRAGFTKGGRTFAGFAARLEDLQVLDAARAAGRGARRALPAFGEIRPIIRLSCFSSSASPVELYMRDFNCASFPVCAFCSS